MSRTLPGSFAARWAVLAACSLLAAAIAPAAQAQEPAPTGTLHIRLLDARDKSPLEDVKAAVSIGRLEEGRDVVFDAGAGRTDADGRMRIAYAPGRLQVQIHVPGYAYALSKLFTLEAKMDHALEFALEKGATARGRVVSKLFSLPVEEAKVLLLSSAHSANTAVTGVGGAFQFADLPAGNHRLRIEHPEHAPREVAFSVETGAVAELDRLPLDAASLSRIALRVHVPDRPEPVRDYDIVVTWTEDDKPVGIPGAVRGIDEFLVKVPPGPATLKVELKGYRPAVVAVLAPPGLTVPVRVRLRPAKE